MDTDAGLAGVASRYRGGAAAPHAAQDEPRRNCMGLQGHRHRAVPGAVRTQCCTVK